MNVAGGGEKGTVICFRQCQDELGRICDEDIAIIENPICILM